MNLPSTILRPLRILLVIPLVANFCQAGNSTYNDAVLLDGPVAFELFLSTAQRLAEGLQAELLVEPKTPLDSASIDHLRRIAAQFVNHEG